MQRLDHDPPFGDQNASILWLGLSYGSPSNSPFMTLARILRFDRDFKLIRRYPVFSLSLRVHFINIFFSIDDYDLVTCRGVQHIHNEYRRISLCIGKGDQCPGQEYGNKFHHLNSNGPFGVEFRILKKKRKQKTKLLRKIRNWTEKMETNWS